MLHLDVRVDDLTLRSSTLSRRALALPNINRRTGVRVLLDPAGHLACLFLV